MGFIEAKIYLEASAQLCSLLHRKMSVCSQSCKKAFEGHFFTRLTKNTVFQILIISVLFSIPKQQKFIEQYLRDNLWKTYFWVLQV